MNIVFLLGCDVAEPLKIDFSSDTKDTATVIIETGSPEPSEEPSEEIITDPKNKVRFVTESNCERLGLFSLNFTRMLPGTLNPSYPEEPVAEDPNSFYLNVSNELTASFFESSHHFSLVEQDLVTPEDSEWGCEFSIDLDVPQDEEFSSVLGDEADSNLEWAFYYPAAFARKNITCTLGVDYSEPQFSCEVSESEAFSALDNTEDPQLVEGDSYVWASNIYLVNIKGDILGSFADMGFEEGWNLATFEGNQIVDVEPMVLDHTPVQIDLDLFNSRYVVSSSGGRSENDTTYGNSYQLALMPLRWVTDPTLESQSVLSTAFLSTQNAWQFSVWGRPEESHFFNDVDDKSSDFFWQWAKYVDVAVELPVVWDGAPSQLDSSGGVELGDMFSVESSAAGAVCKEADRIVYLYLDEPDRPSETLWYQLKGYQPGWIAVLGTQGAYKTWRDIAENTTGSGFIYDSYEIGSTCFLPETWNR